MTDTWDPAAYLRYADERARPFFELLARVPIDDARRVVDLGCGPGNLTGALAARWPSAQVVGVDSSHAMIERARLDQARLDQARLDQARLEGAALKHAELRGADGASVRFEWGDLRGWSAEEPVDVVISNATLQWVPEHLDLLPRLVTALRPGGVLAFGVPANFDQPSHTIRAELAAEPEFAGHLQGVEVPSSHEPATYLTKLASLGCVVDAWETTYLHVLTGADPVFDWVSATGARTTLAALPPGPRERFVERFKERLRSAYPQQQWGGVVLPFRRIFVVATTHSAQAAG